MSGNGKKKMSPVKRMTIATILVVVFVATLFSVLLILRGSEAASNVTKFSEKKPVAPGYLDIATKVCSVDLNKETIDLEFLCIGAGDLVDEDGLLKQDINLSILAAGLTQSLEFEAGTAGDYANGTINLNGSVSNYPWDEHRVIVKVNASREGSDGESMEVPTRVQFTGSIPGLDVNCTMNRARAGAAKTFDILIIRSTITTLIACFAMVLVWILIATILAMLISIVAGGHDLQMMLFAFIGTLIFAMTGFRNSLPGAPPMGVLCDYLAFFWGYAIAIIGIGILTVTWVHRLPRKEEVDNREEEAKNDEPERESQDGGEKGRDEKR